MYLNSTAHTGWLCPLKHTRVVNVSKLHMQTVILLYHCSNHQLKQLPVPSSDDDSNNELSGLNDVLYTGPPCPVSFIISLQLRIIYFLMRMQ